MHETNKSTKILKENIDILSPIFLNYLNKLIDSSIFPKNSNFFFHNDSIVLTHVFSHRSYISEKRIYQKFILKIIFT